MKEYNNIDKIVLNRHESKIEFINSSNSKVGEEKLYRTRLNLGDASIVDIVAKDTKDSLHVDIKFGEPIKCTITRDEKGYTVVKCEREKEVPEFEYEEPPSKSRLMRDEEIWG